MTALAGPRVDGARREALRARLAALGFDEVRFAAVDERKNSRLRDWLDAGRSADMAWLERTAEKRLNPELVLPGVRSVILLGVNYWAGSQIENLKSQINNPRWARYALHADYHDTMKPGLAAAG